MARGDQFGLHAGRQGVGAEVADACHLIEADALSPGRGVDHDAVTDVHGLGLGLQNAAGNRQHVVPQRLAGPATAASPPMPAARDAQVPPP